MVFFVSGAGLKMGPNPWGSRVEPCPTAFSSSGAVSLFSRKKGGICMDKCTCQMCGLSYQGKAESRKHDSYCKKHLKACVKFDTIYNPEECEAIQNDIKQILSSEKISLHEKALGVEKFFRSCFSQSVRDSGFDLSHCSFLDYCARLLSQKYFNDLLKPYPDVHSQFLQRLLS